MRHILYPFLLGILLAFPCVVLGITAHFQSYSVLYEHKFQVPFSYTIAIASLTIAGATAHLISLILDLEASASGFGFRKTVADIEPPVTIILVPFWLGVVIVVGAKQKMDLIGVCISKSPWGYEVNPQLCTEWAISLASAVTTMVALIAWSITTHAWMGRDAFVSRVWQRRQQKANKARGFVPPPAVLPAGAAQVQVAPAAPSLPLAAGPAAFQQPSATIPQNGAAPSTTFDLEATAGHDNDPPQQGSSDPMTSPASPPPSALPSWIQPSTIIGSEPGQLPNSTTGSNAPVAPAASPQIASNPS